MEGDKSRGAIVVPLHAMVGTKLEIYQSKDLLHYVGVLDDACVDDFKIDYIGHIEMEKEKQELIFEI